MSLRGIDIPSEKKSLKAHQYKVNRFVDSEERDFDIREYDYSNLLESGFLDYGIERNPVIDRHNSQRARRDIKLTVDARLQTLLQNTMGEAIAKDPALRNMPRLRTSVVVLDAIHGDLLCSANYPLPDQDSIYMLNDRKIYGAVPFEKMNNHAPITERDLGLTFQTQPGSTAKVMSAMAAFMQMGDKAGAMTYNVRAEEAIEKNRSGVPIEPLGTLSMETSIVRSSNCYFVNLVHDKELYGQLDSIYSTAGVRVNPDPYIANGNEVSYYFYPDEYNRRHEFDNLVSTLGNKAVSRYRRYVADRSKGDFAPMNFGETQAAWGQGPILASPLNMARVVSIVANSGKFVPTRYILEQGGISSEIPPARMMMRASSADMLKSYMQKESDKHRSNGRALPKAEGSARMGGKTGTPERGYKGRKPNDAWYVFFMESETQKAPLAIAVRLERTENLNSGKAVQFAADVVIPAMNEAGYNVK